MARPAAWARSVSATALGCYTTLGLETAKRSLAAGRLLGAGVMLGAEVDLRALFVRELGESAADEYGLK